MNNNMSKFEIVGTMIILLIIFGVGVSIQRELDTALITPITSNMTSYTSNVTSVPAFGTFQRLIASNLWFIMFLAVMIYLGYKLVKRDNIGIGE